VRCASAGAERRGGGLAARTLGSNPPEKKRMFFLGFFLVRDCNPKKNIGGVCADPAYVVIPRQKKKNMRFLSCILQGTRELGASEGLLPTNEDCWNRAPRPTSGQERG
jgi:hypothetical protein